MKVGKKMTEKEIDRLYDILETVVDDDEQSSTASCYSSVGKERILNIRILDVVG